MRTTRRGGWTRVGAACTALFLVGCDGRMPPPDEAAVLDPEHVDILETVADSDIPVELLYVPTWDGLYAPVGLRTPQIPGPHPLILLASGNGGGGMAWVRDAVRNRGYLMERLLDAGYAVAWPRYRAEVDLGYARGGPYVEDVRQGRQLLNRSPLEYEDVIAIAEFLKARPDIDGARLGYVGLSHGGEMALKIAADYQGFAAMVASEPAAHEFLALAPDESASVNEATHLRNLEHLEMRAADRVRARIDMPLARARIDRIKTPILVMGRKDDHLQGIFRVTYELLAEAGKETEWVSFDHPDHGYIYPQRGADGRYHVDPVADEAIAQIIAWFDDRLK